MAVKFNPFTGQLQIDEKGSGGASYIDGEVAAYGDLSLDAGVAPLNSAWLVREASGTWLLGRKPAGIYIRTATAGSSRDADYTYAGILPDVFSDANFTLYDDGDSTKNAKFQLSSIATGTTRTITVPNKNITLDDAGDSRTPTAHASSHGAGVKAYFFGQTVGMTEDVFIRANNVGTAGNITLTFNGSTTINSAISTWNSANPSNQVTLVSGEGSQTPDNSQSIELEHGVNAGSDPYQSVSATSLTVVGTSDATPVAVIQGAQWFGSVNGNQGVLYQGDEDGKIKVIALNKAFSAYRDLVLVSDGNNFDFPANGGTLALTSDIPANTIASTIVDAKGDLIVGTAADTVARLPVGATNGHVLTVDSAEAGGMKWAAATGDFAAASHAHGNLTSSGAIGSTAGLPVVTTTSGAVTTLALGTANQVLRVNSGATGVEFADPSGGGVSSVSSSASDVLGVSGANITGVDANADRIVYWNNTSNKLAYGTPADAGAAAASHTHAASDITSGLAASATTDTTNANNITSGTLGTARLGTGTANSGTFLRGDQTWAAAGGVTTGSVDNAILRADGTGGSTSQSSDLVIDDATTSTQANVALRNNHSETNSALVLTPKGTGAFIVGPKPDGSASGGNARGIYAIDINTERSNASRIASGARSICIGTGTLATQASAIAIGNGAWGDGANSIGIGLSALGGYGGATNNICIGSSTECRANTSICIGSGATLTSGSSTSAVNILGGAISAAVANSFSLGSAASLRAQVATLPFSAVYWGGQTTDATANVELNLDATATNRMTIAANTALIADILLIANSTGAGKALSARRSVAIRRDGSNNTSLIGAVETNGTDQNTGSPTWSFTIDADDTNESLRIRVTGAASETVVWRAVAFYRVV